MENEKMTDAEVRKMQKDLAGVCQMMRAQQAALEKLGALVALHQQAFEALGGKLPPVTGNPSSN